MMSLWKEQQVRQIQMVKYCSKCDRKLAKIMDGFSAKPKYVCEEHGEVKPRLAEQEYWEMHYLWCRYKSY